MTEKTRASESSKDSGPPRKSASQDRGGRATGGDRIPGILRRAEASPDRVSSGEVHVLQRKVGNLAVGRLMGGPPALQPKLTVGAVDDPHEQEADRVAERVVNMLAPPVTGREGGEKAGVSPAPPVVRRKPSTASASPDPGAEFESSLGKGAGSPLPAETRAFMEPRFGADFGGVRVHSGGEAARLNRAVNSQAFTHGNDIYLGEGRGDLASGEGKQLLAHELTHTIQQGAAGPGPGGGAPVVRRFVGSEHAELGNTTGAAVDLGDGVVLTWGQVVAVAGDEYGTVEELEAATRTPEGKARLRAALEHDGVAGAETAKLPEPTKDQRAAQDKEFLNLALVNTAHFPDGGESMAMWASHHARAIEDALTAGLANNPAGINRAYLEEAFGEHFLTDSFSGGHIRTPRGQIVKWYTEVFAPLVTGTLLANLRARLVQALVDEANPQAPLTPEFLIRDRIKERVQGSIDGLVGSLGGMDALTRFVGLGLAGVVSGTIHDTEGEAGVLVSSDAHPEPWRAFGDTKLDDPQNATTKAEATKAVAAAKADVDAAYRIGEAEAVLRTAAAGDPPLRVHFAFNSSSLDGTSARAARDAAAFLLYHPEAAVDLVGHTDPVGNADFNMGLGMRRAQAVQSVLLTAGVSPGQVSVSSEGERHLISSDPKNYRLDRRTEFIWRVTPVRPNPPGTTLESLAHDRAHAKAQADLGPPYLKVNRLVPRPVEERGATGNTALPDWHWGKLTPATRDQIDDWIRRQVGSKLDDAVAKAPQLDPVTTNDITVHPRDAIRAITTQLLAHPTATLGALLGIPAGPP